jgi:nucleoside-diphosphate-sugar epimerase
MDYLTGSNGFLGSHLKRQLKDVTTLPHEDLFTYALEDFENFYFLSSYGNLVSHTDEQKIIQANVLDVIRVAEQINFDILHSFVFISSSSVKRRVQTFYSHTKKAAEDILLAYAEKYNAPICIIRPLSITGVGEQKEHLIPTLIRSCLYGEQMPFVPNAYHDYIDVSDVVSGILALSQRRARGVFELGTGDSHSNHEVRILVEAATQSPANVHLVSNMRSYDSNEWVSTNFKARQYGWEPKKTLADSIREMVKHERVTKKNH